MGTLGDRMKKYEVDSERNGCIDMRRRSSSGLTDAISTLG